MATTLLVWAAVSALSVGASYIASRLNRPKNQQPVRDDKPATLATKGSVLPIVLGTRKIAPIFAWDGDLKTEEIESGGGKGFGDDSQVVGYRYYKAGWHLLCVGTADRIEQIYRNGQEVLDDPLERVSVPSGSYVRTKRGNFRIYWGELGQPVNEKLGDESRVGVASRWPGVCYVHWDRAKLGQTPLWPAFEYVVRVPLEAGGLPGEPMLGTGCNPAHALWRVLTAPNPFGIGLDPADLDGAAFSRLAAAVADEFLSVNVLAQDAVKAAEWLSGLMSDVGFVLPQVASALVPVPVRPPAEGEFVPALNDHVLVDPDPEVSQQHGDPNPTRHIYLIYDKDFKYRSNDVPLDDDAGSRGWGSVRPETEQLQNVTDMGVAAMVAARRSREAMVDGVSYKIAVTRGARQLQPGQLVDYPGVGRLRVSSRLPQFDSTRCQLELLLDQYGDALRDYTPLPGGSGPTSSPPPAADVQVKAVRVPEGMYPGVGLAVARVRASERMVGSALYLSADGSSYRRVGNQDPAAAGGTLNTTLLDTDHDGSMLLDYGPVVTPFNDDIRSVLDLTGNDAEYGAGAQMALVGDEWMYLRRVVAVSGGWQLRGLTRAVCDTPLATHAAGSPVFIVRRDSQSVLSGGIIQAGSTVYVKSVPFDHQDAVDLSTVAPVAVTL